MSKPIKLQKGDKVRRKISGVVYAVVGIINANSFRVEDCSNGNTGVLKRSDVRFVSRPGASPKTAEVAIDVNTDSIESMEKALKEIDSQRDMIADKLLAKKKEERAKANEKDISDMLNSIKSQSAFVQIRTGGNLKGKGLLLSRTYDWNIQTDDNGILVLVPTKP